MRGKHSKAPNTTSLKRNIFIGCAVFLAVIHENLFLREKEKAPPRAMNMKVVGLILTGAVTCKLIHLIWKKRLLRKLSGPTSLESQSKSTGGAGGKHHCDPYFYQVLIYPDKHRACRQHFWGGGCTRENCWFSHEENSVTRFLTHLLSAKKTLDVCVYVITDAELADSVIRMGSRGITIRVITNEEAQNYTGTQVGKFRSNGVQVRTNLNYLMHHKFVVVDRETVISGSFNWTSHATSSNNENMIITNNPHIVQPYVKEFDKLWKEFDRNA